MYGLLVEINIEDGREDDANAFLKGEVVPRVREAPGFVAAYWWRGSSGSGHSLVIFETEEAVKAAAEMASTGQMPMPEFASMGSAEIVEIVAQA